jgi:hypothetical protein
VNGNDAMRKVATLVPTTMVCGLVVVPEPLTAIGVCPRTMGSASLTCSPPSAKGTALHRPSLTTLSFQDWQMRI